MMKTTNQLFLPALALAVIGSLGTAHGAITLGANFSYANGNLTTVSGGTVDGL